MPERADAADASRLVELSVRRGWPLASLRKAPFEDRHAVLAGFALYAEAGKGDAADAAKKFLAGAGSFLSGTPEELMELALEYGWLAPDGAANFTVGPGATKRGLEAEIEFAETLRAELPCFPWTMTRWYSVCCMICSSKAGYIMKPAWTWAD